MAYVIWKYALPDVGHRVPITLPQGARILSVGVDGDDTPVFWAMLEPQNIARERHISILLTGAEVDWAPGRFIGTVSLRGGQFILHVFDDPRTGL